MGHCSGYSAISRSWIGVDTWELRHRTGYWSDGKGKHGSRHSEHFNSTFHGRCGDWIKQVNTQSRNYGPAGGVRWVGDVGVGVCKTGMHGKARAFDLTKIEFANRMVDTNWSWRVGNGLANRRRYLAVAAQCRRYFGTVLTCWYNSDHKNHIHFDNGTPVYPIREGARSDTTLVQASCNLLNDAGIAVDGVWGPATEDAFRALRRKFGMTCLDLRGNTSHARIFLNYIGKHGFANKPAGTFRYTC